MRSAVSWQPPVVAHLRSAVACDLRPCSSREVFRQLLSKGRVSLMVSLHFRSNIRSDQILSDLHCSLQFPVPCAPFSLPFLDPRLHIGMSLSKITYCVGKIWTDQIWISRVQVLAEDRSVDHVIHLHAEMLSSSVNVPSAVGGCARSRCSGSVTSDTRRNTSK